MNLFHLRTRPSVGGLGLSSPPGAGGTAGLWMGGPQPLPLSPLGEKAVHLVMEYMPLGSLRDYLPRHSLGLAQLLLFAQQICEVGQPTLARRTAPSSSAWPECPVLLLGDLPPGLLSSTPVSSAHHLATLPTHLVCTFETPSAHLAEPRSPVPPSVLAPLPRVATVALLLSAGFRLPSCLPLLQAPAGLSSLAPSHTGHSSSGPASPHWS